MQPDPVPTVPGAISSEIQGSVGKIAVAWADGSAVIVIDRPGVVRLPPAAVALLIQRLTDLMPAG